MANLHNDNPRTHKPMGKEEVVRDEDSGKIAEVRTDEHVSADSDLAVQIPDEVNREAAEFDEVRSSDTPNEVYASKAKSSKSDKS